MRLIGLFVTSTNHFSMPVRQPQRSAKLPSDIGQNMLHGEGRIPAAQSFDFSREHPSITLIDKGQVCSRHKEDLWWRLRILRAAFNP